MEEDTFQEWKLAYLAASLMKIPLVRIQQKQRKTNQDMTVSEHDDTVSLLANTNYEHCVILLQHNESC